MFDNLEQAKALGLSWRLDYNHRRPHSAINYQTPAAFAASLAEPPVATLPAAQPAKEEVVILS